MTPLSRPPSRRHNALHSALPIVWAALLFSACACLWAPLAPQGPSAPLASATPLFDRRVFLSQAEHLSPSSQRLAQAYVDLIDELAIQPMDGGVRAQFVASALAARFQYAEDLDVWGVEDYWTSPLEFISKGRGDCEDFAIAAYYMLYASGWPRSNMRMAYARINLRGRVLSHMVLLVKTAGGQLVIDNTQAAVLALAQRSDLSIVFSFDDQTVYHGATDAAAGSAPGRISKWRSVLEKARLEGFD